MSTAHCFRTALTTTRSSLEAVIVQLFWILLSDAEEQIVFGDVRLKASFVLSLHLNAPRFNPVCETTSVFPSAAFLQDSIHLFPRGMFPPEMDRVIRCGLKLTLQHIYVDIISPFLPLSPGVHSSVYSTLKPACNVTFGLSSRHRQFSQFISHMNDASLCRRQPVVDSASTGLELCMYDRSVALLYSLCACAPHTPFSLNRSGIISLFFTLHPSLHLNIQTMGLLLWKIYKQWQGQSHRCVL